MLKIDLHIHSKFSDGKYSPRELIDLAISKKIPAIALTDHDTVKGNKEAIEYSEEKNFEFVPGIEITITPPKDCDELHIVGLFINPNDKEILKIHQKHKDYSIQTAKKVIEKLNNLGYKITFEELVSETNGEHFGRPFIAQILMKKYPEEFIDSKDVFDKLLGKHGKAFVKAKGASMKKAIEIIHNAGGLAILAHPWYLENSMKSVIEKFVNLGGDGIEVDHPKKVTIQIDMEHTLRKIAREQNLVISGGTDFHELKDGGKEIGDRGISIEEFETLKNRHKDKS
ncbi:MAG: PHP domain-containing protein [Nanoarchaeota archaeon]